MTQLQRQTAETATLLFIVPVADPVLLLPRILRIVLVKVVGIALLVTTVSFAVCTARAVPEVIRLAVHAVRRRHDFNQISACYLDRRYLGGRQTYQVCEQTADDGCVPNNQQVFLFSLQLDQRRLQSDFRGGGEEAIQRQMSACQTEMKDVPLR